VSSVLGTVKLFWIWKSSRSMTGTKADCPFYSSVWLTFRFPHSLAAPSSSEAFPNESGNWLTDYTITRFFCLKPWVLKAVCGFFVTVKSSFFRRPVFPVGLQWTTPFGVLLGASALHYQTTFLYHSAYCILVGVYMLHINCPRLYRNSS
jgi:hypothetical protein